MLPSREQGRSLWKGGGGGVPCILKNHVHTCMEGRGVIYREYTEYAYATQYRTREILVERGGGGGGGFHASLRIMNTRVCTCAHMQVQCGYINILW